MVRFCHNKFPRIIFSTEKKGNVMESLLVKYIVGKYYWAYIINA